MAERTVNRICTDIYKCQTELLIIIFLNTNSSAIYICMSHLYVYMYVCMYTFPLSKKICSKIKGNALALCCAVCSLLLLLLPLLLRASRDGRVRPSQPEYTTIQRKALHKSETIFDCSTSFTSLIIVKKEATRTIGTFKKVRISICTGMQFRERALFSFFYFEALQSFKALSG